MAIIGFWSIGGGSGKTTLVANLAFRLVFKDLSVKVGLVDADVEEYGGIDVFLATALNRQVSNATLNGLSASLHALYGQLDGTLLDVLMGGKKSKGKLWLDAVEVMELGVSSDWQDWLAGMKDRLWLMPCQRDWGKIGGVLYTESTIVRIRKAIMRMQESCGLNHVFVDCRNGFSNSGFAAALATDYLVVPVLPNNTHLDATKRGAKALRAVVQVCTKAQYTRDFQHVLNAAPDDQFVIESVRTFFRHAPELSIINGGVPVVPFHPEMAVAEVIAAVPRLDSCLSADDQRYLAALGELWRSIVSRIERLEEV